MFNQTLTSVVDPLPPTLTLVSLHRCLDYFKPVAGGGRQAEREGSWDMSEVELLQVSSCSMHCVGVSMTACTAAAGGV